MEICRHPVQSQPVFTFVESGVLFLSFFLYILSNIPLAPVLSHFTQLRTGIMSISFNNFSVLRDRREGKEGKEGKGKTFSILELIM